MTVALPPTNRPPPSPAAAAAAIVGVLALRQRILDRQILDADLATQHREAARDTGAVQRVAVAGDGDGRRRMRDRARRCRRAPQTISVISLLNAMV